MTSGNPLFDHMQDEHGHSLLDSEMHEIRLICRRMDEREHEEWNRDLAAAREQVALLRMRQQPLIDLLHQAVKWLDRIEGEPKCAPTGKPGTDVRPLIHDIRTILDQNP